ncbi:MAG: hypothetical protein IIB12_01935, partial [Chloroflexi bacterium]|nr:hypothetical protein [Chloroflexota bacterium]
WKVLLPLAFANLVVTAFYLFYGWPDWSIVLLSFGLLMATVYGYYVRRRSRLPRPVTVKLRVRQGRIVG